MVKRLRTLVFIVMGCAALTMAGGDVRAMAPVGHFATRPDGTVLDNATGLVWQQAFSPTTQAQGDAVIYCAGLATAGGGWRLPSVLELASLVDESRGGSGGRAIDLAYFPGTPGDYFWAEHLVASEPVNGWAVSFWDGAVGPHLAMNLYRARCVR